MRRAGPRAAEICRETRRKRSERPRRGRVLARGHRYFEAAMDPGGGKRWICLSYPKTVRNRSLAGHFPNVIVFPETRRQVRALQRDDGRNLNGEDGSRGGSPPGAEERGRARPLRSRWAPLPGSGLTWGRGNTVLTFPHTPSFPTFSYAKALND